MNFGPWSPTIQGEERGKQLRSLAGIARVILGPHHPLIADLRAAEIDPIALLRAQERIEALPALVRRRILATFSAITWPRSKAEVVP